MLIHGQEFDFSLLNANDLDRLEDALDEMTGRARPRQPVRTGECPPGRPSPRTGPRFHARPRQDLGRRGIRRLGLNENDVSRLYDVLDEITQAAAAEKARYSRPAAVPQNRAQRRAEKRKKDKHKPPVSYPGQPVSRSEGFYPQAVPAAQMVERVDKASRRKQLLDELAALENG